MIFNKRFQPPRLTGDWAVDGPQLLKCISDYFLSLELADTVNIDEAIAVKTSGQFISAGNSTTDAWNTDWAVYYVGREGSLASERAGSASGSTILSHNAYFDGGTDWRYIRTNQASEYFQTNGTHNWRSASGTAGDVVSWTTTMALDASGNWSVAGTVSPTGVFLAPNGTEDAPSYSFASDTNIGMYRVGADSIGWAADSDGKRCMSLTGATLLIGADTLTSGELHISNGTSNNKVVGPRIAGYTNAMSGTANRATSYDTATITHEQLAQRVKALQDDLTTHGLIGT